MNKSIMMGRLVRDPEIRYTEGKEGELAIANFRLAVDRKRKKKGEETADFFRCTAFGWLAEFVEEFLVQGLKVVVTGRMQNDNYTNKEGEKVYGMRLMAEEIDFAEGRKAFEERQAEADDEDDRRNTRGNSSSKGQGSSRNTSRRSNQHSESRSSSRSNKSSSRSSAKHSDPDEGFGEVDEEDYGDFN